MLKRTYWSRVMFGWLYDLVFCGGGNDKYNRDNSSVSTRPLTPEEVIKQARSEADDWAKKRKQASEQSQTAYQRGDKAEAKLLSNQSKLYAEKMEKANWRAARAILKPQRSKETGKLDLHGLYAEEAKAATLEFLNHWRDLPKCNRPETVQIITGAGNHSKIKGRPVLRPEVENILKIRELDYTMMNGDGAFLIYVNPPSTHSFCAIM